MPLIAIAGAYLITFIPPLQAMLIDKHTFLNRALYAPFDSLGRATTPCVLIMLGANIASIIQRGGLKEC
jgi:predicted permease